MSKPLETLNPLGSYLDAFANYFLQPAGTALSTAAITGVVAGIIVFVLLVILIVLIVYCCRHRRAGYQSAYDTDEAIGHPGLPSTNYALSNKVKGHPDVKPELFI